MEQSSYGSTPYGGTVGYTANGPVGPAGGGGRGGFERGISVFRMIDAALELGRGLGFVPARPGGFMEELESIMARYTTGFFKFAIQAVQWVAYGLLSILLAVMMYSVFYAVVMRSKVHNVPLYFDYGISQGPPPGAQGPECRSSGTCSTTIPPTPWPTTTVNFLSSTSQWSATHLARTVSLGERFLVPEREYTVEVELEVPESEVNAQLGNWMVQVEFLTKDDHLIARSARSLILMYRSKYIRLLRTLVLAPWIAFGAVQEAQTLRVVCFERFQESPQYPLAKARVSLSTPSVQVYSAGLCIRAQLNQLQWLMFHWFWTSAFAAVSVMAPVIGIMLMLWQLWSQAMLDDIAPLSGTPTHHAQIREEEERVQQGGETVGVAMAGTSYDGPLLGADGGANESTFLTYTPETANGQPGGGSGGASGGTAITSGGSQGLDRGSSAADAEAGSTDRAQQALGHTESQGVGAVNAPVSPQSPARDITEQHQPYHQGGPVVNDTPASGSPGSARDGLRRRPQAPQATSRWGQQPRATADDDNEVLLGADDG